MDYQCSGTSAVDAESAVDDELLRTAQGCIKDNADNYCVDVLEFGTAEEITNAICTGCGYLWSLIQAPDNDVSGMIDTTTATESEISEAQKEVAETIAFATCSAVESTTN